MADINLLKKRMIIMFFLFIIRQSQCEEPVCSRFLYEQNILEKMIRVEIKTETLANEIKQIQNEVKHEMTIGKEQNMKQVEELRVERDDMNSEFVRLKEELTKYVTLKTEQMESVSEQQEAKIIRLSMDLRQLQNTTVQDDYECRPMGDLENGKVFYTDVIVRPKVAAFLCNPGFHLIGDATRTCQTDGEWDNATPRCDSAPVDCVDVLEKGVGTTSGVYTVQLRKSNRTVQVMCDMTMDGGGWTVFQYRFSGTVDFYRTFAEYESGFGSLQGEFWLGLKDIYEMTDLTRSEVYLEFVDKDGDIAIERFNEFHILAGPGYDLHLGSLIVKNDSAHGRYDFSRYNRKKFSTKDKDQDEHSGTHCAELDHNGWWEYGCTLMNPNGHYATPGAQSSHNSGYGGMVNYSWKKVESLKSTRLMFRRMS